MFTLVTHTTETAHLTLDGARDYAMALDLEPTELRIGDINDLSIPMSLDQLTDVEGAALRVEIARGLFEAADDGGVLQSADIEALDHGLWLRCGGNGATLRTALGHV